VLISWVILVLLFSKEDATIKKKIFLFFLVAVIGIAFMTVGAYKAQAQPIKLTYSKFSHQPIYRAN